MNTADLTASLVSWRLAMQAERKSRATIDAYVRGSRYYLEWVELSCLTTTRWTG